MECTGFLRTLCAKLGRWAQGSRRIQLEEARAPASRVLEGARSEATAFARRAEEDPRTRRALIEAEVTAELEAEFRRIAAGAIELLRE